ncbi:MAG: DUF2442 domain-containing protein [Actinomycetota bacterium]
MEKIVDVEEVEVVAEHRLRLIFFDGSIGEIDFSGRDWQGIFSPLKDPVFFAEVTVDHELGTIVWPNGADMAPETLHERAMGDA